MIFNDGKIDEIYNNFISYLYNEIVPGSHIQQTREEFERNLQEESAIVDSQPLEEVVCQFVQPIFQSAVNHNSEVFNEKENAIVQAVNIAPSPSISRGEEVFKAHHSAASQHMTKLGKRLIQKRVTRKKTDENRIKAPVIRAKTIKWSAKEEELLIEGIKEFGCHWRWISTKKQLSHDGPSCSVKFQLLKQKGDPRLLAILSDSRFNKETGISKTI